MGHSRAELPGGARAGSQGSDEQQSVSRHKAMLHRFEAVCKPTCRPRHPVSVHLEKLNSE